jgi:predicted esterase
LGTNGNRARHSNLRKVTIARRHEVMEIARLCHLRVILVSATIVALPGISRVARAEDHAVDNTSAVQLASRYLESTDDSTRRELAEALAPFDGDRDELLRELSRGKFEPVKAGYHPAKRFTLPGLAAKHPDDLLYFNVPRSYQPHQPTGLIVFLHGGGRASRRNWPEYFMDFPARGNGESQLGDVFNAADMVAVGPSAPWDEESAYRWCLVEPKEHEEYLGDVILECKARFNIDPDRVFLIGHSMGGFGAYHHIQRQPDRFAAVVANAGAWYLAHWPVIRGTPLCIIHGVRDADRGRHYTDIEYARLTHALLKEKQLEHVYRELDDDHHVYPEETAAYLAASRNLRRDPYARRVALASPVGFKESRWYLAPVRHNRWLSLDETAEGEIDYDKLESNGAWDSDDFELRRKSVTLPGASIEAENSGDNVIRVATRNVTGLSLWLHPRMVDTNKPVTVIVDGKEFFRGAVKPSLVTALDSYARRHDWGLIYPIRLRLRLDGQVPQIPAAER